MMKVYVSIKLRCAIAMFDIMLWGLMRRAFTLFRQIPSSYMASFQSHKNNHSGHIEKVKAEISDCGGNGS